MSKKEKTTKVLTFIFMPFQKNGRKTNAIFKNRKLA